MSFDLSRILDENRDIRGQLARLTHTLDQVDARVSRLVVLMGVAPRSAAPWWRGPSLETMAKRAMKLSGRDCRSFTDAFTPEFQGAVRRVWWYSVRFNQWADDKHVLCPWCTARVRHGDDHLQHLTIEILREIQRQQWAEGVRV